MAGKDRTDVAGEELIKQELITREELDEARKREAESGTPWYKQLMQTRKLSFGVIDDVLRYEFHSKSARTEHQSLGTALLERGELTTKQLEKALAYQKRNGRLLGNVLLELGFVTRESIAKTLSKQYNIDFSSLESTPSERAALETVPESMARKNDMLPVSLEGDRLIVLVVSPQMRERLKPVAILLGKRIHALLTATDDLRGEIGRRYATLKSGETATAIAKTEPRSTIKKVSLTETIEPAEILEEIEELETDMKEEELDSARFEEIAQQASGTSVMKMVSTIIEGAVNSGATDVHMDPQDPEMRVRYRIDGVLHDIMSIPENLETAVISRIKILSDLDITETRHPQDGHISMDIGEREFDIRVASLPTYLGERVVLRLLDQSSVLQGIKDLGLEPDDEKKLSELIDQPYGMILVTGPTGSGKTTTLYAALNQKNVMTDSIVTLEDPVEYQLSGINQVQIDTDIGLTFASTLRASLRQDIDVLLVGEIRDAETARIAIRAAMTGHLVFSTLHTNDAPEAISTLQNMGIPSHLISSALTAIIAQRLVRTICKDCRTGFKPSPALLKSISLPASIKRLYRGKGCGNCYNTGNRGRTGIFEILEVTETVRKMINDEESVQKIMKASKLSTMAMRCRQKVRDGIVTPEEFLRIIRT